MKIFSLFLFSLILTVSCNKSTVSNKEESQSKATGISGTWELRHLEGGYRISGSPTDFPPGNGFQWKFTDSTYQTIKDGTVIQRGYFSVAYGTGKPQLVIDRDTSNSIYFDLNGNQLILYRGVIAADGDIETYARL